jgi:hypothetical protein
MVTMKLDPNPDVDEVLRYNGYRGPPPLMLSAAVGPVVYTCNTLGCRGSGASLTQGPCARCGRRTFPCERATVAST